MEIPIYEGEFSDLTPGVYGVSLVGVAATGIKMLSFNENVKIEFITNSLDEQIVTAPILIPNQKIYRNDDMGEWFVYFSKETIKKVQQNFLKQGYQHNSTINHTSSPLEGITIIESWLVKDPNNDKSAALGFKDLTEGTWMVSMKIDNNEIWNDYIKSGKLTGLSVDSMFNLKRINQKQNMKFNSEAIKNLLQEALLQINMQDEVMPASGMTGTTGTTQTESEVEVEVNVPMEDSLSGMTGTTQTGEQLPMDPIVMAESGTTVTDVINPDMAKLEDELKAKDLLVQELEAKLAELEAKLVESQAKMVSMAEQTPSTQGIKDVDLSINQTPEPTTKYGRILSGILNVKNK